jgi:hypothetical protein
VQEDAGPTTRDLRYLLQVRRGGRGGLKETPWPGRNAENILDLKRQHN